MIDSKITPISCEQFAKEIQHDIDVIKSDIEAFDERAAIQNPDDGKTSIERALEALNRKERFAGEHQTALAFLQSQGALGARFSRFVK